MSLSSEILTVAILFFVILIFKPHGTIFKQKARLGLLLANANSGYLAWLARCGCNWMLIYSYLC